MTGQRAAIYARISEDRTGAGLGVQRQTEDCQALAAAQGDTVVKVFTDNDASAYSGKIRPGYRELLSAMAAGDLDVVLAWHTDRIHRSPLELEEYITLSEKHAVTTRTVQAGKLDLSTSAGRMTARIHGAVSRQESEHKAERIKRKAQELALAGKWLGGMRPFGWKQTDEGWQVDEAESEVVRMACNSVVAGRSLGAIVNELNGAGLTTSLGKPWGYTQLRQVVKRPRNAGLAEYHGDIVGVSEFPAIVSEDVWRAACSVLSDPSRRRSQSNKAVHLLSGIAQCHCGELVRTASIVGRNREAYKVYRCPAKGLGHVGKRIETVDAMVSRTMVAGLAYSKVKPALEASSAELEALRNEARALRQRLTEAASAQATGGITIGQLVTITSHVEASLKAAETRMEELGSSAHRPSAPGGWPDTAMNSPAGREWSAMDTDTRRDHVRSMLNVILFPHVNGSPRVFDPMTVLIRIKQPDDNRGPLTPEQIAQARKEDGRGFFTR